MPRDGTHRIRSIDPDFWRHPKTLRVQERDPIALLLLLGIRSAVVDDAGRFRADQHYLKAEIMPLVGEATAEKIGEWLELLQSLRFLHLYESEGTAYGTIHDWRDWQRVDRATTSKMPPPPADLCRCCRLPEPAASDPPQSSFDEASPKVRRGLIEESSSRRAGQEGLGEERLGEEGRGGGRARPRTRARTREAPAARKPGTEAADKPPRPLAACSWCKNPTDPENGDLPETQRLMQVYHDAYRAEHASCPAAGKESSREGGGKEWGAIARILKLAGGFAKARRIVEHGVASQDPLIIRRGHILADIVMNFQGIQEALDRGETHGITRRPSGRVTPAPPESFGAGGFSKF